ncbi:syntaxin-18 [Culicoides brevitarsis]|uniref:syntaxin-18 n=1 Tax=Culicoides brevitarsis TaxID=469753 RepID=UPI00307C4A3B
MDITQLFKACIKTAKLQDGALPVPDKNRILKQSMSKNDFLKASHTIRNQVTQLRNLLMENRAAYLEYACHLKDSAKMTDKERDILDEETSKIINICTQMINDFRGECRKRKPSQQFADHLDGIIELLMDYLKAIDNLHKQQKEYRVNRQIETYKFLKLGAGKSIKVRLSTGDKNKKKNGLNSHGETDEDEEEEDLETSFAEKREQSASYNKVPPKKSPKPKKRLSNQSSNLPMDDEELNQSQSFIAEEEINPEDLQMLEQENKQLFTELQGLSEEVEQIEKNVVGIAKLQDIFTEKVTLQKSDIDRIANSVVGSTENVKDANEQIKQAIQRNAGLRVYVLFFLLVMSFTLLFLDWYND